MQNEILLVHCHCETQHQAETIAHHIVEQHLAACVNITGPVHSIYRWQGGIESEQEFALTIKCCARNFDTLCSVIRSLHSYETPEILATPILTGDKDYLLWLEQNSQ